MNWISIYIFIWLIAMFFSWIFTRLACRYAFKFGLVDKPKKEAHKQHRRATPVAGGVAMCAAWITTLLLCLAGVFFGKAFLDPKITLFFSGIPVALKTMGLIAGCAVFLTMIGMIDDHTPMKAGRKFFWQIVIATITATFGPQITIGLLPYPCIRWIITVCWILTVMNALNFFDNMDGLAGGSAAIATFFLLIVSAFRGQFFVASLTAATGGSICGFLFLNAPPAKIFMGDSGSHFLGYCLALLCIMTTFYLPENTPTFIPTLIPLMILAVQLFDAAAVVLIRLKLHKPIYIGDNRHISHRFTNLGLRRSQAVIVICLLCFASGAAAVTLLWLPPIGVALVCAQILTILTIISLIQFYIPENNHHETR